MGDGAGTAGALTGRTADGVRLSLGESAAMRRPTFGQAAAWLLLGGAVGFCAVAWPDWTSLALMAAAFLVFSVIALWRLLLVALSRPAAAAGPAPEVWPRYTILAALHDEAEVTPQLIGRLAAIDYPVDRLEGFLVVEAHDKPTIQAALRTPRPPWLKLLIAPPGAPQTKPRALNVALAAATGDFLTVYDAEDDPHPLQLREAATAFSTNGPRLGCLQAPLRVRQRAGTRPGFLDRQFAIEYAALFEVTLPAMARLGLPFPLGGTSNHFRVEALRAVGGWDAFNVTEDADLGFRLWANGWTLGVTSRPTFEPPPGHLGHWLPQRMRWLKGFMQTWGVHTRRPWRLGWKGVGALSMTVGAALLSALTHAPSVAWVVVALIVAAHARITPITPVPALMVLLGGACAAWLSGYAGARRAGVRYDFRDMLCAPAYWCLLSAAFAHALWRLIAEPFVWDKTAHTPDIPEGKELLAAGQQHVLHPAAQRIA